jgi:hypothetical protein
MFLESPDEASLEASTTATSSFLRFVIAWFGFFSFVSWLRIFHVSRRRIHGRRLIAAAST